MVRKANITEEFLAKGGTLLRKGNNSAGEPVIMQKKSDRDWHERLTFTKLEFRDKTYNYLLKHQPKFFYRG